MESKIVRFNIKQPFLRGCFLYLIYGQDYERPHHEWPQMEKQTHAVWYQAHGLRRIQGGGEQIAVKSVSKPLRYYAEIDEIKIVG